MPSYVPSGALFRVDPTALTVTWVDPLVLALSEDRPAYLAELLAHQELTPWRGATTPTPQFAYRQHVSRYQSAAAFGLVLLADGYLNLAGGSSIASTLLADAMLGGPESFRITYDYLTDLTSQTRQRAAELPPAFVAVIAETIRAALITSGRTDDPLLEQLTGF